LKHEILKARPDFAQQLGSTIEKAATKLTPKQLAEDVDKEAFKDTKLIANLTVAQTKKLGEEGSAEKKQAFKDSVNQARAQLNMFSATEQARIQSLWDEVDHLNPNWQV